MKNSKWFLLSFFNYYYLFLLFQVIATAAQKDVINTVATTDDTFGRGDYDEKEVAMWHGPQQVQAGREGRGSRSWAAGK